MPLARANGIELCYETFGEDSEEPLVLVSGLGSQMLSWDIPFCDALVDRDVGASTSEAMAVLLAKPAATRDEYIEKYLAEWKVLSGPGLFDEPAYRSRAEAVYDRCYYPAGTARQLLGVMASGSRTEGL